VRRMGKAHNSRNKIRHGKRFSWVEPRIVVLLWHPKGLRLLPAAAKYPVELHQALVLCPARCARVSSAENNER